jgi:hypothetical protein
VGSNIGNNYANILLLVNYLLFQLKNRQTSKKVWPKGPGFGLPLKGAVLVKAVQVKSV